MNNILHDMDLSLLSFSAMGDKNGWVYSLDLKSYPVSEKDDWIQNKWRIGLAISLH